MQKYEIKKFEIGDLSGISKENIEEHLKLYAGYVNNTNLILEQLNDEALNPYAKSEVQRRFSFEFNGMKNHEYYFESLSGKSQEIDGGGDLYKKIEKDFESFENWLNQFKNLAKTRGIGWAMLSYDKENDLLINHWVDEQHLGQLNSTQTILALDMWEHSFVSDYLPSGKGKYIDDFFVNLNWGIIEKNYNQAIN